MAELPDRRRNLSPSGCQQPCSAACCASGLPTSGGASRVSRRDPDLDARIRRGYPGSERRLPPPFLPRFLPRFRPRRLKPTPILLQPRRLWTFVVRHVMHRPPRRPLRPTCGQRLDDDQAVQDMCRLRCTFVAR